jgi:hypothetical protein
MFTYNYRIFDKYGQNPVSLAVLADENSHWKPSSYHVEQWGFESYTKFPTVKLLDYADQLEALQASDNAFAILTDVTRRLVTAEVEHTRLDLR